MHLNPACFHALYVSRLSVTNIASLSVSISILVSFNLWFDGGLLSLISLVCFLITWVMFGEVSN